MNIRDSARGENCTVRIPHVCNGNPETTVLAHLNSVRFWKGVGIKTDDIHAAYACSACHAYLDGHVPNTFKYSRDELRLMHLDGVIETQLKLKKKGLM